MWRRREKAAIYNQGEKPQKKPVLPIPWSQTSSLHNCLNIQSMILCYGSLSKLIHLAIVSPSSSPPNSLSPISNICLLTLQRMFILKSKRLSITFEIKEKHFSLIYKALLNWILLASQTTLLFHWPLVLWTYQTLFCLRAEPLPGIVVSSDHYKTFRDHFECYLFREATQLLSITFLSLNSFSIITPC